MLIVLWNLNLTKNLGYNDGLVIVIDSIIIHYLNQQQLIINFFREFNCY